MLLQRSRLAALEIERPRLAPPWVIAVAATFVGIALVVVFPHRALIDEMGRAPPGPLTEAYLTNLLRTEPNNPVLRLALARKQMRTGEYQDVRETLSSILASSDERLRGEAQWLVWEAGRRRLAKLPPLGREHAALRADLRSVLASLVVQAQTVERQMDLSHAAFELGDTPTALALLARRIELAPRDGGALRDAARLALSHGEYRAAADFRFEAARRADTIEQASGHFLEALRALRSGDLLPEALRRAEHELADQPHLAEHPEVLLALVEAARAAARPDLADRYVRRLLRLSLLESLRRSLTGELALDRLRLAAYGGKTAAGEPGLPFDDRVYRLAYEIFIENRKLDDAYRVAASAVRQAPEQIVWRERLAQVSEWTNRPQVALDQWWQLARRTGREAAWQAVLRLAPGLFDDAALKSALEHELGRRPGDPERIKSLVAVFERLADPEGALAMLAREYARAPHDWLLAASAELAERAGLDDQAIATWERLAVRRALLPDEALRLATLHWLRGDIAGALHTLTTRRDTVTSEHTEFWRLLGTLAQQAGDDALAIEAFQALATRREADTGDRVILYQLLAPQQPLQSARVALDAWRRQPEPQHLRHALTTLSAARAWQDFGRVIAELPDAERARLGDDTGTLRLLYQWQREGGRLVEARASLEALLARAPDDVEARAAWLWLLIDLDDPVALRRALVAIEERWRREPALHDALGAAYLALSRPDVALTRYYTPRVAAMRDDFLWMMNYADALEQNGAGDQAWRLRAELLRQAGPLRSAASWPNGQRATSTDATGAAAPDQVGDARRIARARLLIAQRPGEPAAAILRELLRQDRDAEARLSPAARVVVLAWLQERQAYQAERGFLWQQFARHLARPLWAEITLALVDNDLATAGELLARHGERLPRYDRIDAARRIGDLRGAQTDAFETQQDQPDDAALHLRLSDTLLAHSDHAGLTLARRRIGELDEQQRALQAHLALSPALALDFELGSIARRARDAGTLADAPGADYGALRALWRTSQSESRIGLGWRHGWANFAPLSIEHDRRFDDRVSLNLGWGRQLPASESLALRVAGMKTRFAAGLAYRASLRDTLRFDYAYERYRTQSGVEAGSGRHQQMSYHHALRLDDPDLDVGIHWARYGFRQADAVDDPALTRLLPAGTLAPADDFFVPRAYRLRGLSIASGLRHQSNYSRAPRPYFRLARVWNSAQGPGYDLAAGIAGSVFGADHLKLGFTLAKAQSGTSGLARELVLSYRLHY